MRAAPSAADMPPHVLCKAHDLRRGSRSDVTRAGDDLYTVVTAAPASVRGTGASRRRPLAVAQIPGWTAANTPPSFGSKMPPLSAASVWYRVRAIAGRVVAVANGTIVETIPEPDSRHERIGAPLANIVRITRLHGQGIEVLPALLALHAGMLRDGDGFRTGRRDRAQARARRPVPPVRLPPDPHLPRARRPEDERRPRAPARSPGPHRDVSSPLHTSRCRSVWLTRRWSRATAYPRREPARSLRRVFADDLLRSPCGGRRSVVAFVAAPSIALAPNPRPSRPHAPHSDRARVGRFRVTADRQLVGMGSSVLASPTLNQKVDLPYSVLLLGRVLRSIPRGNPRRPLRTTSSLMLPSP